MIEDGYFELMDSETINRDFDDIDLFGEKLIDDDDCKDDDNIEYE